MNGKRRPSFPRQILICLTFSLLSILAFGQNNGINQRSSIEEYPKFKQIVESEGNYNLAGKKFFVQDKIGNSSSEENQDILFDNYLRQSLMLRGAEPALDSLNADFLVRASVRIGKRSEDILFTALGSPQVGRKGARADAWKLVRDTLPYDMAARDKRYQDKGLSGNKAKHFEVFNKTISIEFFDSKSKSLLGRTDIYSYNLGKGFEALSPNEAMLFIAADSYGRNLREVIILDKDNSYYEQFRNNSICKAKGFCYAPNTESSSEGVRLFLVDRRPDKTIVIVKDAGKMRINTKKKQAAYLRVGDSFFPCSDMTYNTDNWRVSRLLKVEFPPINENDETIDLLFCRPGKPDKIKHTISEISL